MNKLSINSSEFIEISFVIPTMKYLQTAIVTILKIGKIWNFFDIIYIQI
jgi:hypothetical protein